MCHCRTGSAPQGLQASRITDVIKSYSLVVATAQQLIVTRQDGQSILSNPALLTKADADSAACEGERAKAIGVAVALSCRQEVGFVVYRGCTADRGYVVQ